MKSFYKKDDIMMISLFFIINLMKLLPKKLLYIMFLQKTVRISIS